jgi:hypothetical protein
LYHSAWNTLKTFFSNDPALQGKGGMFCILHTWGQTLSFHPHLHCLVPAAGINSSGELKLIKGKDKFLFNIKNMSKVFRAKFAEELTRLEKKHKVSLIPPLTRKLMFSKSWVIFSQRPFSTPENVVRYIGMYSHRVAISENRILEDKDGMISFTYKDYKDNAKLKILSLDAVEFFRRFAMHILPYRFMKIRYYGLLNNLKKKYFLEKAIQSVGKYKTNKENQPDNQEPTDTIFEDDLDDEPVTQKPIYNLTCPLCKKGRLQKIAKLTAFELYIGIEVIKNGVAVYKSRDGPEIENFIPVKIQI